MKKLFIIIVLIFKYNIMKYLVFSLKSEIPLNELIKLISINYDLLHVIESDFIKSNNSYIYNNQENIDKILELKKNFNNIDQLLYFETDPKYIPYFNIININKNLEKINLNKTYILPTYFNNPNYDNYYIIEFNMIDYIKYIYTHKIFNKNIDKLNDLNSIVSNFDIIQFETLTTIINVIAIYKEDVNKNTFNNSIFDNLINNIKKYIKKDTFYRIEGEKSKVLVIIDQEVNNFLNTNIGKQIIDDFWYSKKASIEIYKNHLNKFKIDYASVYDIYNKYNKEDNIILNGINYKKIRKYYKNDESQETFFVIEGDPNKIHFLKE